MNPGSDRKSIPMRIEASCKIAEVVCDSLHELAGVSWATTRLITEVGVSKGPTNTEPKTVGLLSQGHARNGPHIYRKGQVPPGDSAEFTMCGFQAAGISYGCFRARSLSLSRSLHLPAVC